MSAPPVLAVGKRAIQCVAALTPAHRDFKAWHSEFQQAANFRALTAKQSWVKAWWLNLESNFKVYLLVMTCGDDWQRWFECEWLALDDGLRDAVMMQVRSLNRELSTVAWR